MAKECGRIQTKWPGQPSLFLDSIIDIKHRWASPWTHKHFLAFKTGNSVGESAGAAVSSQLNTNFEHAPLIATLVSYSAEDVR